jgi:hypothetical protein
VVALTAFLHVAKTKLSATSSSVNSVSCWDAYTPMRSASPVSSFVETPPSKYEPNSPHRPGRGPRSLTARALRRRGGDGATVTECYPIEELVVGAFCRPTYRGLKSIGRVERDGNTRVGAGLAPHLPLAPPLRRAAVAQHRSLRAGWAGTCPSSSAAWGAAASPPPSGSTDTSQAASTGRHAPSNTHGRVCSAAPFRRPTGASPPSPPLRQRPQAVPFSKLRRCRGRRNEASCCPALTWVSAR